MFRHRPTPATVISLVALFVALGGTTYAAATIGSAQIKNNSIRGKDIRKGAVSTSDIKTGGVRSADVKNGALRARDFRAGELPAGPPGPQGVKGDNGTPGSARGYALVFNDGSVDESRSLGVADANVSTPTPGVYCFNGLSFTPNVVVATPEATAAGALPEAAGTVRDSDQCPGAEQAAVVIEDGGGAAGDNSFMVLLN